MEAPKPQESINLTIEDEKKKYNLIVSNSSNSLVINISEQGDLLKKEYSKEFTLRDLSQNGKFFKIFDDIASVIISLKETFENKKPQIKEENNYIELKIIPILTAMGETTLIIPIKKSDDKEIINNLCDIIKVQANDIKDLKARVTILEQKMQKIEENNNYINKRIKNKDSLIGDIIKNEEQYNLICDYIDKNKAFKFELLYKGTKDGDTYDIFHKKCDNQGPTISIIESTDGQIFGGYASKSWDINNKSDIPDPDSFLFNININKKYGVSNNKGLIYGNICDFGGGCFHELWLHNNYFSQNGGCDNGNGFNFKNYELSGGKNKYKVKECEVYKVIEIYL